MSRYRSPWCPQMRLAARVALWAHVGFLLLALSAFLSIAFAQSIPRDAQRHQATLKREAQRVWGLAAPVATLAAQVHQESRWIEAARSPVGAVGLAQFMPATSSWIGGVYASLGERAPTNPTWALRALVTYDRWLADRIKAQGDCERMAFTLSAYNGGLGWVYKRQKLSTEPGRCLDATCTINPGVTPASQRENQHYPEVILRRYEPLYAGWGAGSCS
jgi:soluble lytic murein transglycosylase-like protein